MAPSKQSLLPLDLFVKKPKLSLKNKHKKLEKKSLGISQPYRGNRFVDKKRNERIKEEQRVAQGAEKWRLFLETEGVQNPETMRLDILFLSNGPAPDHSFPHDEEKDDNHVNVVDSEIRRKEDNM